MIIRVCFPFYKTCPAYDRINEQCKTYKGEHKIILVKAQGTLVHDVRNSLVLGKTYIEKDFKLPEFDFLVMVDSDVNCSLDDIIYLAESGKDIISLPYVVRGNEKLYNAGYLTGQGCKHIGVESKGIVKVGGSGNGCKGWTRKVFETVEPFWFWPLQVELEDGVNISLPEDWAFDYKASLKGFDIYCDLDRPIGHNIDIKSECISLLNQCVNMVSSLSVGGSQGGESP